METKELFLAILFSSTLYFFIPCRASDLQKPSKTVLKKQLSSPKVRRVTDHEDGKISLLEFFNTPLSQKIAPDTCTIVNATRWALILQCFDEKGHVLREAEIAGKTCNRGAICHVHLGKTGDMSSIGLASRFDRGIRKAHQVISRAEKAMGVLFMIKEGPEQSIQLEASTT